MTNTMTTDKPTDRQIVFLLDLIVDREVETGKTATESTIELTKWLATPRSRKDVSRLIDKALACPKRAKPAAAAAAAAAAAGPVPIPDSVPNLKFALRTELLVDIPPSWRKQEFVFLEVKNLRGKRVLRRLLGAPGIFTRNPVPKTTAKELIGHLSSQKVALEASTAFAEIYSVCKRCGAELTDDHSRAVLMGPVCEKLVDEWLTTGKEPSRP